MSVEAQLSHHSRAHRTVWSHNRPDAPRLSTTPKIEPQSRRTSQCLGDRFGASLKSSMTTEDHAEVLDQSAMVFF